MKGRSATFWTVMCCLAVLVVLVFAPNAQALPTNNFLDQMVTTYQTKTRAWEGIVRNYALRLFWILAAIEFTWSSIKLALKGADISEFLAELLNRVLYIGIFLTLLLNSSAWSSAIVDSFRQAGSDAVATAGGNTGIAPSNALDAGWLILKQVVQSMTLWQPGDLILIALAAIIILIAFAMITALLICALVESYFVISSGVILMGFGGSQWTNQFAINTIRYAVSVGVKLFMVQLVIGLGESMLWDWSAQMQAGNFGIDDVMMIAAASLVFLVITKSVPDMAQALINGSSLATGGALSGMVAEAIGAMAAVSAAVASGGTATAAGAAAAAHGSYSLASETLKSDPNYQRGSTRSHLAALTGEAIKGSVAHIGANLGQRFRGEIRHGNIASQVGYSMSQQAAKMKELRQSAAPPDGKEPPTAVGGSGGNRIYPQSEK